MATKNKTYSLDLLYEGLVICSPIENVINTSGVYADDVVVKLESIPDGLTFSSSNLPKGLWDEPSLTWTIGQMAPGESLTGMLCWTIDDTERAPYNFVFTVGLSDHCETCDPPNKFVVTIKGFSVQDLMDAGVVVIQPGGPFASDAEAAVGGVKVGEYYTLSDTNLYGLPEGHPKQRTD